MLSLLLIYLEAMLKMRSDRRPLLMALFLVDSDFAAHTWLLFYINGDTWVRLNEYL